MLQPRDTHLGYEWGSTFSLHRGFKKTLETAALVAAELQRIQGNRETLEPEAVVDASRPEDAPLHPAFTWDDSEAAERWRVAQARDLQRGVRVVLIRTDGEGEHRSEPVQMYASISPKDEIGGYRQVSVSIEVATHRRALLQEALNALGRFRAKYRVVTELSSLMGKIDELLEKQEAA